MEFSVLVLYSAYYEHISGSASYSHILVHRICLVRFVFSMSCCFGKPQQHHVKHTRKQKVTSMANATSWFTSFGKFCNNCTIIINIFILVAYYNCNVIFAGIKVDNKKMNVKIHRLFSLRDNGV